MTATRASERAELSCQALRFLQVVECACCGSGDAFQDEAACKSASYATFDAWRSQQIAAGEYDDCEERDGEAGENEGPHETDEQYLSRRERGLYA
jgi:hypothetical protein